MATLLFIGHQRSPSKQLLLSCNQATGEYLLVWVYDGYYGWQIDFTYAKPLILGRRLGKDALPIGCPVPIYQPRSSFSLEGVTAALACDSSAEAPYLLLWTACRWLSFLDPRSRGEFNIEAYFLRPDGTRAYDPFPVGKENKYQTFPAVISDTKAGRFLSAWQADPETGADGHIRGRVLPPPGQVPGLTATAPFEIAGTTGPKFGPQLAYNEATGECLVVYGRQGALFSRVYLGDKPVAAEQPVTTDMPPTRLAVTWNSSSGEYLLTHDAGDYTTGFHVYASRLDKTGKLVQGADISSGIPGLAWCGNAQTVHNPDNGDTLVVFATRAVNDACTIHALRLDSRAMILGSTLIPTSGSTNALAVTYNRVTREYLIVWSQGEWLQTTKDSRSRVVHTLFGCRLSSSGQAL